MTANKSMTGEQLDELMTVAVNMQRDSEKAGDRSVAMFAYAVQVAVLELKNVRDEDAVLTEANTLLKNAIPRPTGHGSVINKSIGRIQRSSNKKIVDKLILRDRL